VPAIGPVARLSRRPYEYATSAPLEHLVVDTTAGATHDLLFKDLDPAHLLPAARSVKPAALHDPHRTVEAQTQLLDPLGVGPRCWLALADDEQRRWWLITDKVDGVELWQVGELATWERVAAWLGGFHARFLDRADDARRAASTLLEHDAVAHRAGAERAARVLRCSSDPRAEDLLAQLADVQASIELLASLPRTFLHGELYPSNVLVGRDGAIWPVDWEMAATGPAVLDLAALVTGWDDDARRRMVAAYGDAGVLDGHLDAASLHLALRWIGWSSTWRPPREHARDWIGEALAACERLAT
jgi:aminoglycoside phosphotransferase (APT) family kinase protein